MTHKQETAFRTYLEKWQKELRKKINKEKDEYKVIDYTARLDTLKQVSAAFEDIMSAYKEKKK